MCTKPLEFNYKQYTYLLKDLIENARVVPGVPFNEVKDGDHQPLCYPTLTTPQDCPSGVRNYLACY